MPTVRITDKLEEGQGINDAIDEWIYEHIQLEKEHQVLKELVKEFFVNYLDVVEESDSGKEFHPIYIGCSRALKTEGLNNLLERMRDIAVGEKDEQ